MKSIIILLAIINFSFFSFPQQYELSGIREIPAQISDIAIASFDNFGPVIYYNPFFVANAGPYFSAFIRAHEYGHHHLNHITKSMFANNIYSHIVLQQKGEIEADSFATEYWAIRDPEVIRQTIIFFNSPITGNMGDLTHLPSPMRAELITNLFNKIMQRKESDNLISQKNNSKSFEIKFKIWSKFSGDPAEMDIYVDNEFVGSISNLDKTETLALGELSEGNHNYSLKNIIGYKYDYYGNLIPYTNGVECSGNFKVSRNKTFKLSVDINSVGRISCSVE